MLYIEKMSQQIVRISADSQKELGNSLLRFQESYENPEWKGKVFTLGQFRQWYSEEAGSFSYATDWSGFNFPSHILEPFKSGLFDPLTKAEKIVVKALGYRTDRFYVIGAQRNQSEILDHEICHALFYTNKEYCKKATAIVNKYAKQLKEVFDFVESSMYHKDVHLDEVHAYASADPEWLKSSHGVHVDIAIHKELRELKDKYFKQEEEI